MSTVASSPQKPPIRKPRLRGNRLVLYGIDWRTYERLLRAFDHTHVRLTYDRGTLEIMTVSLGHEGYGRFLGRLVTIITVILGLRMVCGGSVTMRRRKRLRGLEPDDCYWIANERAILGKTELDLRKDPPPDLSIEVEVTRSVLNRMSIYEKLRVPEIWRWDGTSLTFHLLGADGKYFVSRASKAFPWLQSADLPQFLAMRLNEDDNTVAAAFETWARAQIAAQPPAQP